MFCSVLLCHLRPGLETLAEEMESYEEVPGNPAEPDEEVEPEKGGGLL